MKKRFLKYFVMFFASFLFLFTLSSCGNENKYLEGDSCGEATVGGTNAFSEMRRVFCERYVYEYNLPLVQSGEMYAEFKEQYSKRFSIKDNVLVEIDAGTDEYNSAHYLFVYFDKTNYKYAFDYLSANVDNYTKYMDLMAKCANGKLYNEASIDERNGYFPKINNLGYDKDAPSVSVVNSDGKTTTTTVTSVADRMTSHSKACLVFDNSFVDPTTGVIIPKTPYKAAWDVGLIFGLFVYPMAWLINLFVSLFGGSGWAQIGAIILVTFILKILILLITFKSQASTQKMQDIQPEIAKVQSKYGPTPTQEERQRMAMELMGVYRKYGVKPLAPFASLLITFPVFIAMYRAVMYLGVLRTGKIWGVTMGNALSGYIIGGEFKFFALIIFLVMATAQILSMKLPQIINRRRMSDEARKQQKQTGKQARMMTNIMMIMILVMGFFMPVTMSIYWIASAIVGIVQSLIMHRFNNANKDKKGKYKVKKVEERATIPQGYRK